VKKVRDLESLVGAQVNFFLMKSFDEKDIAEQIDIIQMPAQSTKPSVEVSQEPFNGIVKSVASFGVFIKVPGHRDGLLHVSKIPDHLKEKMEDFFTTGKSIQVKIQKVTEKGIELQLVEKL
jgi:ribosomal protein S1